MLCFAWFANTALGSLTREARFARTDHASFSWLLDLRKLSLAGSFAKRASLARIEIYTAELAGLSNSLACLVLLY